MVKIKTSESRTAATSATTKLELPAEIVVLPFTVLVDTREQQPWTFHGLTAGGKNPSRLIVPRKVATLETGDYSIEGRHHNRFAIERKSADDLVGSVCGGHARFEREHERMAEMIAAGGAACVLVEGSLSVILDELRADGREAARRTLLGCAASWQFRFCRSGSSGWLLVLVWFLTLKMEGIEVGEKSEMNTAAKKLRAAIGHGDEPLTDEEFAVIRDEFRRLLELRGIEIAGDLDCPLDESGGCLLDESGG